MTKKFRIPRKLKKQIPKGVYDEMLGLVTSLTFPHGQRPCLNWLKTKKEHKAWNDRLTKKRK